MSRLCIGLTTLVLPSTTFRNRVCWLSQCGPRKRLALSPVHTTSLSTKADRSSGAETDVQEPNQAPNVPLCERPPTHAAQLKTLLEWQEGAARRVSLAEAQWQNKKDAPCVEDLKTELSWLLDDAVAGIRRTQQPWEARAWRDIERQLSTKDIMNASQVEVQLRESLDELDVLWNQRLKDRVPLQYLTSCVFWRDLVLSVGPGVLIPRPETELMIDFLQEAVERRPDLAHGDWVDLGTGSGALAIGIARALPFAQHVWAIDLAAEPAAHAAYNAKRYGVDTRVFVLRGSWYEPLAGKGVVQVAGIVSNPPYVPADQIPTLQTEVGLYEPRLALAGGDGLGIDALAPICRGAVRMLRPGGFLALETAGGDQARYVGQLLNHLRCGDGVDGDGPLAFEDVRIRRDLRGVDRFVTAIRT